MEPKYDMRYVASNATYVFFEINNPNVIVGEKFSGGQALQYLDDLNEGRRKPLWGRRTRLYKNSPA